MTSHAETLKKLKLAFENVHHFLKVPLYLPMCLFFFYKKAKVVLAVKV